MIYQYAQEALEELAVNGGHGTWEVKQSVFETPSLNQLLNGSEKKEPADTEKKSDQTPPEWAERLKGEMESLKQLGEETKALQEMAKFWEEKMANKEANCRSS